MPFALRGAKLAMQDTQNNVADWLPDDYVETVELKEFSKSVSYTHLTLPTIYSV